DNSAEVVELALIDSNGTELINTLVCPYMPIPSAATAIHGITDEDVKNWPRFYAVLSRLHEIVTKSALPLYIYNSAYDLRVMAQSIDNNFSGHSDSALHQFRMMIADISAVSLCAMLDYAEFHGSWDDYRGGWKWQKLTSAVSQCGIDPIMFEAHSAFGDCLMTLEVIKNMINAGHGGYNYEQM
ncbi:3'-5' exonuclease, partial [Amycolatopsis tucumanensis]|uniref:3'-5' exonuclease n=1 Tax=Amycolatopsis tucumanensis TaxID=401106 RepID=UPI0031EFF809